MRKSRTPPGVTPNACLDIVRDMASMKRTFQRATCSCFPGFRIADRLLYETRDDLDRDDALEFDFRRFPTGGNYIGEFSVLHQLGRHILIYVHLPDTSL
ncbi:hypothetical protein AB1N83_007613 [Pleurotus pulmonarius]